MVLHLAGPRFILYALLDRRATVKGKSPVPKHRSGTQIGGQERHREWLAGWGEDPSVLNSGRSFLSGEEVGLEDRTKNHDAECHWKTEMSPK